MSVSLAQALLDALDDEALDALAARLAPRLAAKQASEPTSPWMSVADAAGRMRCKPDRIYDLISQRKLTPRRDGRRVLLRAEDVDAYLEASG